MPAELVRKSPPAFIDELYVRRALAQSHTAADETCVQIEQLDIEHVSQPGENFCSDIYRVYVKYAWQASPESQRRRNEQRLIVKLLLAELSEIQFNELVMYETVLPQLERLRRGDAQFSPNCIYTDHADKELFMLQDMSSLGYRVGRRDTGLSEQHARVVLRKLAAYHASSIALLASEEQAACVTKLAPSHFSHAELDPVLKAIVYDNASYVLPLIASWPGYESIAQKLQRVMSTSFAAKMREINSSDACLIKVVTHGDVWVNNILFRYANDDEAAAPLDAVFIDYQNSFVGTPAVDLNFFLYTSVALEVLQCCRFELLRHYYDELVACLGSYPDYRQQPPTWQTFVDEMRRCEMFAFYAAIFELPLCCMDKTTSAGFSATTFADPALMKLKRELLYKNERVLKTMRFVLDLQNELGVYD